MPFLSAILEKLSMNKTGIVNVRMVITEEKILSNIEKVQKMINPRSKKQIIQLEEDSYFKDLIDSIKTYLVEYPKKKNFPRSVYKACYDLVEFATNQFEENTKKIEELIIQREKNIALAYELKETLAIIKDKTEGWEKELETSSDKYSEDIAEALGIIANGAEEEKTVALKLVDARINNLESNFHIEIDMERIEDKSKALSYIGIEIADALKGIPKPSENIAEQPVVEETVEQVNEPAKTKVQETIETPTVEKVQKKAPEKTAVSQVVAIEENEDDIKEETIQETVPQQNEEEQQIQEYEESISFEKKPSLWQKFKKSKFARVITYVFKIRIRIELPNALPEGRGE